MNDEGFREIQLNGKQLVFLFMAATVVSVVIFLCGVLVGRGVRTDRLGAAELASSEIAADEGATPASEVASPPPSATTPAAPADPPPPAAEELSYPERLQRDTPAKETLKSAPPAAPVSAPPPAARTPPPSTAARSSVPSGVPSGPGFAVQVAVLENRQDADKLARQLSAKGYPAFVLPVDGTPKAMFRVRVGKYRTQKEARAVSARLEKEEHFKPWIAR